jgi:membrane carboxypeptidase/penicillin-binding protein PbpC
MRDVSGIAGAGPIWHDFMTDVLQNQPALAFARPDGLVQAEICADSGLLPGDRRSGAQNGASDVVPCPYRRLEWFVAGTEPTAVDNAHRQVAIDVRTGREAGPSTPPTSVRLQAFWALPAEYLGWAQENGIPQPPEPGLAVSEAAAPSGWAADSLGTVSAAPVESTQILLVSPDANRVYRIDPRLPTESQRVAVTAVPGTALLADGAAVSLLLDGTPLARVSGPDYTAWWQLQPGSHTFQAWALGPKGQRVTSEPITVLVQ